MGFIIAPKAAKAPPARPALIHKVGKVAIAGVAAVAVSMPANAAQVVKLGGDDGSLAFVPANVTIKAGEQIEWVNNAGFPHNIVFDEDDVPSGVNADALSAEEYLNSPGQTVTRKFEKAGKYKYYCEPHSGAGMTGTITVQ